MDYSINCEYDYSRKPEQTQYHQSNEDTQFSLIQKVIEEKENMLFNKYKKLSELEKDNKFLLGVRNDYAKYYEYIIKQKQQQIEALENLNSYIEDLKTLGKLTEMNTIDAKEEQYKIVNEIKLIKMHLDEIVKQY